MAGFDGRQQQSAAELEDFNQFAQFLEDACGISLGPNKQYLVSTRINRILTDNNIESLSVLLKRLSDVNSDILRRQIVDAMTTNETYWFRDAYPFEYLKDVLIPEIIAKPKTNQEILAVVTVLTLMMHVISNKSKNANFHHLISDGSCVVECY